MAHITLNMTENLKIAVVIPSYKVKNHIMKVINQIGSEVCKIYIVDDCCPDGTGAFVKSHCVDKRIVVIKSSENQGVGGAVIRGYKEAIKDSMDIIVKIDGDNQMDPRLLLHFVNPIVANKADYTKGNRFFNLEKINTMPKLRLLGNALLSFITKFSSGYWNIFDPTNGYTAIHADVASKLPFNKISNCYFFETDMLFHLNILRAVVLDIPMDAKYDAEISNLKISKVIWKFFIKHIKNFSKRVFYNYYLRDMSLASIELPVGMFMLIYGTTYGAFNWISSIQSETQTPNGVIMLSSLLVILGVQFLLAFVGYDISSVPRIPLHHKKTLYQSN